MEEQPSRRGARPRVSHQFVAEHRRRRYVDAAAELLHEFGREGPTVTNIVRLAATARNSFYEAFGSAEECIAYGAGLAAAEMFASLADQDGEGEWIVEVAAAVTGFYTAVAEAPLRAELLLFHSAICRARSGREALPGAVDSLAALLARGRGEAEARGHRPPPPLADEYLAWVIVTPATGSVRGPALAALPGESRGVTVLVGGYYLGSPQAVVEALEGGPA